MTEQPPEHPHGVRRAREDDDDQHHIGKWHRTPDPDDNGCVDRPTTSCPYCDDCFTTSDNLDAHVQAVHTHICSQSSCGGISFRTARLLSIHLEEAHSPLFWLQARKNGSRMLACFVSTCNGKSSDSNQRRRHLKRSHAWDLAAIEETTRLIWQGREQFHLPRPSTIVSAVISNTTENTLSTMEVDAGLEQLTTQVAKLELTSISFGKKAKKTFRTRA